MASLSLVDFADLFGTTRDMIPPHLRDKIAAGNWKYEILGGADRDAVVMEMLRRIDERRLTYVENEDKTRWEKGWGENRDAFNATGGDLSALIPKYIRPNQAVRLYGDFVRTEDPNFELNWYVIFRQWFFETYLKGYENIFEFGSGSGFNVAMLGQMYPEARITGLDWASPSVEIVECLRKVHKLNTVGRQFDFFHPDQGVEIPAGSAIFTVGALEQTGTNWGGLLDFFMSKKPACIYHIEPMYEWYDHENNAVDYTAWKAHEVRNFWRGFPQKLIELERMGKARILKTKRANFGSLVIEGYSQLIWQPI